MRWFLTATNYTFAIAFELKRLKKSSITHFSMLCLLIEELPKPN